MSPAMASLHVSMKFAERIEVATALIARVPKQRAIGSRSGWLCSRGPICACMPAYFALYQLIQQSLEIITMRYKQLNKSNFWTVRRAPLVQLGGLQQPANIISELKCPSRWRCEA